MEQGSEIVVRLVGGRRVEAQVGAHRVLTDQPVSNGGEDAAVTPFQLFLASIGACAGIFVQGFCAKRGIPVEGIAVRERASYGPDGALTAVDLSIELPPEFPGRYADALLRAVDQCSVKKAIRAQPEIRVRTEAVQLAAAS